MSIRLTEEEVRDIVYEESEKYFLIDEFIIGTGRWSVEKSGVIQSEDNKNYMIHWSEAATEMQENEFWSQTAAQVEQQEVVVKKWKQVNRKED